MKKNSGTLEKPNLSSVIDVDAMSPGKLSWAKTNVPTLIQSEMSIPSQYSWNSLGCPTFRSQKLTVYVWPGMVGSVWAMKPSVGGPNAAPKLPLCAATGVTLVKERSPD